MAGEDGKVIVKTTLDNSGLKKGTKQAKNDLNSMVKSFKNFTIAGIGIAAVTKAVGALTSGIKDCVKAYETQRNAELSLEAVARNNPYFNNEAVKGLKKFASELQSVSNYGDEYLMPLMTELVASGRTQSEVQEIIKASADIASTGLISMDSAVQSLNRSLSGEIGTLGRLLPKLKNLTKEELESGKAIEEIKKSFGGLAETTASEMTQISNRIGDIKEDIGKQLMGIDPVEIGKEVGLEFVDWIAKGIRKLSARLVRLLDVGDMREEINELYDEFDKIYEGNKEAIFERVKRYYSKLDDLGLQDVSIIFDYRKPNEKEKLFQEAIKSIQEDREFLKNVNEYVNKNISITKDEALKKFEDLQRLLRDKELSKEQQIEYEGLFKILNNYIETEKKLAKAKKDEEKAQIEQRDKLRAEYDEKIAKAKEEIALRKSLGEKISEEEEAQELLNVATSAYIAMMSSDAFKGNNGTYSHEVNARKDIANWGAKTNKKNKIDEFLSVYGDDDNKTLQQQIEDLNKAYNEVIDLTDKSEQEKYKIKEIYAQKIKELEQGIAEENMAQVQKVFNYMSKMFSNLTSSLNTFNDMATTNAQNNADIRLASLEKEYSQGIVSEEDYYKQKEKIEKDQAKQTYKMQMWVWGAQVLQAQASMAQSMLQVLADETITSTAVKVAMMATIGALGATQLAQTIANKPIPPSFATGGIVGGSSYSGDKISANVNSGEMILNERQQLELWRTANGATNANTKLNVMIKNYMGDSAEVNTQINGNDLIVTIDKIVQQGLSTGKYGDALTLAQNKQNGTRYIS